jgi:hypothetical protein
VRGSVTRMKFACEPLMFQRCFCYSDRIYTRDANPQKHKLKICKRVASTVFHGNQGAHIIMYSKTSNLKNLYFSRDYLKKLKCVGGP